MYLYAGASSGIGKAIACEFAKHGAKLVLVSTPATMDDLKSTEQACKSEGTSSCECIACDLSNVNEIQDLCSKCTDVDVLVNNAGIFMDGEPGSFLEADIGKWEKVR